MNLGNENVATTLNSYLPVTTHQQLEIIRDQGQSLQSRLCRKN